MSSFVVVAEGIQYMWDEEVWALNLMSISSIFTATKPDEIDRVYQDKLAGRDPKKGKGRAVDDDTPTPADLTKSDRRLIERVQVFSRFQVGFVDHNRKVGPSNRATQAEKSGLVDTTPLAQEDEELSRPVEVNGALNSPSQSAEIPRTDLQMVVSNNQTLPSPRDDEAPRIEDEPNPTPAAQVDPPLEEEINLGPSPSSTGGENRDTLPNNRNHIKGMRKVIQRTKKVVDETKACVTKDTRSAKTFIETQTPSTSRGTKFEEEVLKALKNTEMMMDFIMEGMSNLHAGKDKIQKE
nr:hypothetical protein Iba_chr04eCG19430 [Ipomoea batatas]